MNNLITRILSDKDIVDKIKRKLPPAFEKVEKELPGNPVVGVLRKNVIVGMLMAFLGESKVQPVEGRIRAGLDCYVGGHPLSIKTVSTNRGIRIKWTANANKAVEFINSYRPHNDLLIIRIVWGG